MTSTRNQKAKRSKTRKTRRKARTVHRGGAWGWPWKKGNAVVPEPITTLKEVSDFLLKNTYPNTFRCLEAEHKIKIDKRDTSQIYPCQSSPAKIEPAPVQEQRRDGLKSESNPVSEPIYEKYTKKNPTRNGWYVVKDSDQHFGSFNILKHDTLHNKEDKSECSLAQFGNDNVTYYLEFIEKLPNPSDVYIFNDGLGNNKELSLKCENNNRLIWVDNSNTVRIIDTIYYNPENPLTITYQNKDYVLTKKVEP